MKSAVTGLENGSLRTNHPASQHLGGLLDALQRAGGGDRVLLGDLITALGPAGPNALLLLVALIALSPATIMFGVASVCGCAIALICVQCLWGTQTLWIPTRLRRVSLHRSAMAWLAERMRAPFVWVERRARPRLSILTCGALARLPYAIGLPLGCAMPLLELVPLSATTSGAAITLMVLGLLLKDGVFVLAGVTASVGVAVLVTGVGNRLTALVGLMM